MARLYSNNHTSFDDADLSVGAHVTSSQNLWVNLSTSSYLGDDHSFYNVQTLEFTMAQANQIIEALSNAIGEYEEAKALAEFDAQRDSIFEEESV